jgi:hypothetical protein
MGRGDWDEIYGDGSWEHMYFLCDVKLMKHLTRSRLQRLTQVGRPDDAKGNGIAFRVSVQAM